MNQIPWSSEPRLNLYMTFLLIVVLRTSSSIHSTFFLSFFSSEDLLVSLDDALEVGVEGKKDC